MMVALRPMLCCFSVIINDDDDDDDDDDSLSKKMTTCNRRTVVRPILLVPYKVLYNKYGRTTDKEVVDAAAYVLG